MVKITGTSSLVEGTNGTEATVVADFVVALDEVFTSDVQVTYQVEFGPGLDPAEASDFSSPLTGTVTIRAGEIQATASVAITPDHIVESNETFTIVLIDAVNATIDPNASSVNVTIVDDDLPPVAENDTYTTAAGTPLTVAPGGVLANDTGAGPNETLLVTSNTSPSHGTLTLDAAGGFTYTPDANYDGADSFQYSMTDGFNGTSTATVDITINPANETLIGGASNDTLVGGDGSDTLDGGAGNDTLDGGVGNDTLTGGDGSDVCEGDAGNDTLDGGAGDDTLIGGDGGDLGDGGAGNDTLDGGAGNDTLDGGDGSDLCDGGVGNDTLDGGAGDDTLMGGDGSDACEGDAGNDTLDGGAGNDTLDGGVGGDSMQGGPGDDVYYVDDPGDVVIEVSNEGVVALTLADTVALAAIAGITDTVIAAINYSLANVAYVENLTLNEAGTGAFATGNELDNVLTGNTLDNTLSGLGGNDTLSGGAGNDALDGGAGIDAAVFNSNRAAYTITRVDPGYTVGGPEGSDTLSNIERLQFADKKFALDLDAGQAAGNTVRIIGAAFDAPVIQQHPDYVGIGLQLFDSGMSMPQVCQLAIGAMGSPSNVAFVTTVYTNVVGVAPSAADRDFYVGLLQGSGGTMTQADLLVLAANADVNAQNINLVGLQQSGVEFV